MSNYNVEPIFRIKLYDAI